MDWLMSFLGYCSHGRAVQTALVYSMSSMLMWNKCEDREDEFKMSEFLGMLG